MSNVSAGEIWTLFDCWAQVILSWRHTLYWDIEVTGIRRDDFDKDGSAVTKCLKIINSVCTSRRKKILGRCQCCKSLYTMTKVWSLQMCVKPFHCRKLCIIGPTPFHLTKAPLNFFSKSFFLNVRWIISLLFRPLEQINHMLIFLSYITAIYK